MLCLVQAEIINQRRLCWGTNIKQKSDEEQTAYRPISHRPEVVATSVVSLGCSLSRVEGMETPALLLVAEEGVPGSINPGGRVFHVAVGRLLICMQRTCSASSARTARVQRTRSTWCSMEARYTAA